jgi:hypothetical protein
MSTSPPNLLRNKNEILFPGIIVPLHEVGFDLQFIQNFKCIHLTHVLPFALYKMDLSYALIQTNNIVPVKINVPELRRLAFVSVFKEILTRFCS